MVLAIMKGEGGGGVKGPRCRRRRAEHGRMTRSTGGAGGKMLETLLTTRVRVSVAGAQLVAITLGILEK